MATKYKIHINDLERPGGIAKLEKDGFSREQISKTMYDKTEGMKTQDRTKLMEKLHERNNK